MTGVLSYGCTRGGLGHRLQKKKGGMDMDNHANFKTMHTPKLRKKKQVTRPKKDATYHTLDHPPLGIPTPPTSLCYLCWPGGCGLLAPHKNGKVKSFDGAWGFTKNLFFPSSGGVFFFFFFLVWGRKVIDVFSNPQRRVETDS